MNNKIDFLVDSMLGNIARKLRLLGFNSKYFSTIKKEQFLIIAKNENRVVVTKDHHLASICNKQNIPTIELLNTNETDQIIEICKKLNISKCKINMDDTRCTLCNGVIESVEKKKILDVIPMKVVQNIEYFWMCNSCNKIYWKGTHIRNLQKFIGGINEKL